jgi:hypothetical protein
METNEELTDIGVRPLKKCKGKKNSQKWLFFVYFVLSR